MLKALGLVDGVRGRLVKELRSGIHGRIPEVGTNKRN